MAYCVRCGVKLESGATVCPLCSTEVLAPAEVIGQPGIPLFPNDNTDGPFEHPKLDKNRKGVIELVIAFMAIAVITLVITAFALGASFSPWLPIGCVVLGGSYLLVGLFVKPTYQHLATWFAAITIVLLFVIDISDRKVGWSAYANLSIVLFWVTAVAPWTVQKRNRIYGYVLAGIAVPVYLLAIDALAGNALSWSVSIALPTYGISLVASSFLVLRIRFGKPTITDIVMSLILVVCWGVVAADFFHLRTLASPRLLSWSSSVFIVAVCIMIFLTLNLTVRRVRHYFNNRVV
ncbi:MAG: DUF6320 domain-containing protein [Sphaerochaetaceae bacterium]